MVHVIRRDRTRSLLAAAVVAVLAAAVAVVIGNGARAHAATSGYSYAVVLTKTDGTKITLRRVSVANTISDQRYLFNRLTDKQQTDATKALNNQAPGAGFTITKAFDNADKAQAVMRLADTKLTRVTLAIGLDGKFVEQKALAPAYVTAVSVKDPRAGTTGAITEVIQIAGVSVTHVSSGTPPSAAPINSTGSTYTASLTIGGKAYLLHEITGAQFVSDAKAVEDSMSPSRFSDAQTKIKSPPTGYLQLTNDLSAADVAFFSVDWSTAQVDAVQVKHYVNGALLQTWDVTNAYLYAWSQGSPFAGKTGPTTNLLRIAFDAANVTQG